MSVHNKVLSIVDYAKFIFSADDVAPQFMELCELCGGSTFHDVASKCLVKLGLMASLPVRCCLQCGLIYQAVRFTDDQYRNYYADSYKKSVLAEADMALYIADQKARGELLYNVLAPYVSGSGSVLDVGCSTGGMLLPFREHGWVTHGCDPDCKSVAFGAAKLGLELSCQSAEEMHFREVFDVVIITGSLENVTDMDLAIRRSLRAMKQGGLLLLEGWALAQAKLCGAFGHNQKRYLNEYSLRSLFSLYFIEPIFIRRENLSGSTRPGSTFALGRYRGTGTAQPLTGVGLIEIGENIFPLSMVSVGDR